MLRIAVVTPNPVAADAIEMVTMESRAFRPCYKITPVPHPKEIARTLTLQNPAIVLLDLGDWIEAAGVVREIQYALPRAVIVGFRPKWNRTEQIAFEAAGILDLLEEPFAPQDIEAVAYEAIHRRFPIRHQNLLTLLPAKAGSGCSTVALHLATAIAAGNKTVLLIECDQRSGPLSIMLSLEDHKGLPEALEHQGEFLSPLEWRRVIAQFNGVDLLLSNPTRRGRLPSWADFYELIQFVQNQYDYIIVDLPEVINQATAEFVRNSRAVFVVCQPELASLKMAKMRRADLEACEIPSDHVKVLVNRWERGRLSLETIQQGVGGPVFATLPNDYREVSSAVTDSRIASPGTSFHKACDALARTVSGLPENHHNFPKFTLLRRLSTLESLGT